MATIGLIVTILVGIILFLAGLCYSAMTMYSVRANGWNSDSIGISVISLVFLAISFWCGYNVFQHLSIHLVP